MRWRRPSLFAAAALLSGLLLLATLVGWVRSYPHSGCLGWARGREANPAVVALDSYTVQASRGTVWCGRCRVTVITILGFREDPAEVAATLDRVARYLDVFSIPDLGDRLTGFGRKSGATQEFIGHGFLVYEVDGVVAPSWSLALVTAILPALWVVRRVRRGRAARPAATSSPPP